MKKYIKPQVELCKLNISYLLQYSGPGTEVPTGSGAAKEFDLLSDEDDD